MNPDTAKQSTPGPWYTNGTKIQKDYGDTAYTVAIVETTDDDETKANAALIALAPDLLKVYLAIREWQETPNLVFPQLLLDKVSQQMEVA